jgi:CheY-like chemotaxis protein
VEAYAIPCPSDCKSRILVSVTDTGIGIADDKIDLLFKPFSQISEGYRRDFQGAGLGLAICKQLVGLMGGSIAISSEPGQGTSAFFTVTFGNHERASEPQGLAAENVPHRLSPLRILLAEDDEVNRVSVSKLLESCGHSVVTVPDGSQALFTLTMDDFDVVLMDVQMPVMDGVEATKAIRRGEAGEDKADTKIIALTAYAMTGDKDTFLKAGMNDYLAKPVVLDELQSILSTHTHGAA